MKQLESLVAILKWHLAKGDTEKAEEMVFQVLVKASLLGGFSYAWNKLTRHSADWNNPNGPTRIFLHSLKVLAIIRLRQKDFRAAGEIFSVISRLDAKRQSNTQAFSQRLYALQPQAYV